MAYASIRGILFLMDQMEIDGKNYLSSKKAAELTGYAKDYVGQLCREGRVTAKLIGRSWYVSEESIKAHRFGEDGSKDQKQPSESPETLVADEEAVEESTSVQESALPDTWDSPTYTPEVREEVVPLVTKIPQPENSSVHVDAMQNAWKEWFERMPEENNDSEGSNNLSEISNKYNVSEVDDTGEEGVETLVHIQRVVEPQVPTEIHEMDVVPLPRTSLPERREHAYKADYVPDTHASQEKVRVTGETRAVEGNLAVKALCIGLIVVIVSITLIALGVRTPFSPTTNSNVPFIDYLEGQTHL